MRAEVKTITPEMAEEMLATSQGNRTFKASKVAAYSRDMAAGKWSLNGETIIFDATGALSDGHHRLKGCVIANAPFTSLVVYGAPLDAQKTIDMGASRTSGDALSFYGYKNANNLNAIVRILMSMENGRARSANPSTQEVFAYVQENPETVEAAAFASSRGKVMHKVNSILGAIYCLELKAGSVAKVLQFSEVLSTGIPAYPGCAAHALRERILKDEIARNKVTLADRQLLILTAWEKFKVAAPVKNLKPKATFSVVGFTKKESA